MAYQNKDSEKHTTTFHYYVMDFVKMFITLKCVYHPIKSALLTIERKNI